MLFSAIFAVGGLSLGCGGRAGSVPEAQTEHLEAAAVEGRVGAEPNGIEGHMWDYRVLRSRGVRRFLLLTVVGFFRNPFDVRGPFESPRRNLRSGKSHSNTCRLRVRSADSTVFGVPTIQGPLNGTTATSLNSVVFRFSHNFSQ